MKTRLLHVAGVVLFFSSHVHANHRLLSYSIEELMNVPISSSTLYDETQQSVPAAVTVFTRDQIRTLGFRRLQDLMNFVPGFQVSRTDNFSGSNAYSVHGRRLGTTGLEVLVLLDGQRLNSDWFGGANLYDADIALDNVERIEFLRGPGSALYGSNALMGVVNIITRSDNELALEAGEDGFYRGSAQWHTGDPQRNLSLFARHLNDDGQSLEVFQPAGGMNIPTHDPMRGYELYVKSRWDDFAGSIRHTRYRYDEFYVIGFVDNDANRYDTESTLLQGSWQHSLSGEITLVSNLGFGYRQYELASQLGSTPISGGITEMEPSAQIRLQDDSGQHRWLAGAEIRRPKLEDRIGNSTLIEEPHRSITGIFGQYQQRWRQLVVTLGGRVDDYSDFGQHVSPRLGIVYDLGSDNTLKALYAESFRAPTRIESWPTTTATLLGNPNLDPEVARTTQLIWLRELDHGTLNTTLFYTDIADAISEIPATNAGQRTWENGHSSHSGIEVEWQYSFTEQWSTMVALTRLNHLSNSVSSETDRMLAASITYHGANGLITLRNNYQGPRQDVTELDDPPDISTREYNDLGGRSLWDLHGQYRLQPDLVIFATASNLSDKQYFSPAGRDANTVGVPSQARRLFVGIRWSF